MRKHTWVLILGLLLIISLACDASSSTNFNGLTGSANDNGVTCQTVGRNGECSGELGNLTGTFYKSIQNKNLSMINSNVNVTAKVSVGSGTVKVYVLDAANKQTSIITVKAGETATLQGQTPVGTQAFKVFFEAVGDKADKVAYTISYSTP